MFSKLLRRSISASPEKRLKSAFKFCKCLSEQINTNYVGLDGSGPHGNFILPPPSPCGVCISLTLYELTLCGIDWQLGALTNGEGFGSGRGAFDVPNCRIFVTEQKKVTKNRRMGRRPASGRLSPSFHGSVTVTTNFLEVLPGTACLQPLLQIQ